MNGLGKQMSLFETEAQTINIPGDVWNTAAVNHDLCLVGRLISGKSINLKAFERTMLSGWNVGGRVSMHKLGEDRILVQFSHVAEKKRVLSRSPWAFDKNMVVLRPFLAHENPAKSPLMYVISMAKHRVCR